MELRLRIGPQVMSVMNAAGRHIRLRAKATIATVLFGVVALPAGAEGPGWVYNLTVKNIVVTSNGGVNVRFIPDISGCTSQSGYGGNYASLYPQHPGFKAMHANLLLAYSTGAAVHLYLSDATCTVSELMLGGL